MVDRTSVHPSLGPHEGKELELMLENKKELSLFYTDSLIPDEFIPYIEKGQFFCKTFKYELFINNKNVDFEYYIISQEEKNPNIYKLAEILGKTLNSKFSPDLEREIGFLLGYDSVDIEYYISHILNIT